MSDTYDYDDTSEENPDDSPVLREVRAKLRAEAKQRKELEAKLAEVEAAAQTRRAEAAKELMNTLGFPGLTEDVLNWVEGDITPERVVEALQARSLPLPEDLSSVEREPRDEETVGRAANVGQRVADVAGSRLEPNLDEKIAEATSPSEIQRLMDEAGLSRNHS